MSASSDHSCSRARAWISRRVDGDLSQLEAALVDAHLKRCADCRSFAADVSAFTAALHAAAPEVPEVPFEAAGALVRRQGRMLVGSGVAATLAAAAAAAVAALLAVQGPQNERSAGKRTTVMISATAETPNVLRNLRRTELIAVGHPQPRDLTLS